MSKFCSPAAASRKSMQGNNYERTRSRADGGWGGGGVLDKIGRGARCPSPKLLSCCGELFESDSNTANLIFGETKG